MSVPELTEQDQALLDFVNMEITEKNVKEAHDRLEDLAVGYLCFGTTYGEQDVGAKVDESRQDLRKRQALDFYELDDFQRETQNLLRDCISHRQEQPSDLPWTKAKEILRLRDKRRKNPKGAWPTRFDIQPWTTPKEIAEREKKLRKDRQGFQARQKLADTMRERGKTLEEVHQVLKDQIKQDKNTPLESLTNEEIQQAEEFLREPLSLEEGIAYKLRVSETDVKAVLKIFDTNKRGILGAYSKGQLKLVHAFRLAQGVSRFTDDKVSEFVATLLSPDKQEQAPEEDRITLKDLEDETIPRNVQNDLNERIMRCRLAFDFKSGRYGLGIVYYDQEKLFPTNQEDKDLRIQAAPAIAEFLHRHAERLGCCEYSGCGLLFVAKRKGKTLCDRHSQARAQAKYRATHRKELKKKAQEYRKKYPLPLVRRKKRG